MQHPLSVRFRRFALSILAAGLLLPSVASAEIRSMGVGGFEVSLEVLVEGNPEQVYDAFTGDISGWWDRSFSESPKAIVIEPIPGGRFMEIFDDQGNGALHATVIFAQRGKRLRFEGPMGYSGFALQAVHNVDFVADDNGTRVLFTVRSSGQHKEDWPAAVEGVWKHFLEERFKPYMSALLEAMAQAPDSPSE